MKSLLLLLLLPLTLAAQGIDAQAERARIAAQRKQLDADYAQEEKACRARFAVNDCVAQAKAKQREGLTVLRRQEITLNDIERKRKGEDKARELLERQSAERQPGQERQRKDALQEQKQREARHQDKSARKQQDDAAHAARSASSPAGKPLEPKVKTPSVSPAKAQANKREFEKRQAEAAEHRAQAEKREAQRTKPKAAPLPVPP